MSTKPKKAEKTGVVLLRPGVGKQDYHLPAGATLGDLFRAANVDRETHEVLIDGRSLEDSVTLQPGAIVSVTPRPKSAPRTGSWRETIGMFKDIPEFRELVEAVEKSREAEKDRS
jgi:hypothetical protein